MPIQNTPFDIDHEFNPHAQENLSGPLHTNETYRPLHDYVVVRKKPRKRMTEGGIALPEELTNPQRNEHSVGVVLAVGPGKYVTTDVKQVIDGEETPFSYRHKPDLRVGQEVVFNPYQAKVINTKLDLTTLIVPASEILAVVEEGELTSI